MLSTKSATAALIILFTFASLCYAKSEVISTKVDNPPIVDGNWRDPAWTRTTELVTHDKIANLDIAVKSVYTHDTVFFMVRFSDPDESRLHKPWVWNPADEMYDQGYEREDCFVIKWALEEANTDLSVHADSPYTADVWFWKAHRTDPTGYADDKIQRYSTAILPKSKKLQSKNGTPMYLQRKGDHGDSAYRSKLVVEHAGDKIPQFEYRKPSGSRADIKAKGRWDNSAWCVEFSRPLLTGHSDDIQFDTSKSYFFGVSRYEIAGREPDPKLSQPLYGSGDVSEKLYLIFNP